MEVCNLLFVFVYLIECSAIINKNAEVNDSNQSASEYRTRNTGGRVRFDDDYDSDNDYSREGQRIRFDGPVNTLPISPTSISFVRHGIPVIGYRSADPSVQVESTYRNVEQTSGPLYKQVIVTEVQDDNLKRRQLPRNTVVARGVPQDGPRYVLKDPRQQGRSHTEYATKTMIQYPDGYAKGENIRTEERSQYKQDSRSKQGYKKPPIIEVGTSPQVRYTNKPPIVEVGTSSQVRYAKKPPIIEVGTSPKVRYTNKPPIVEVGTSSQVRYSNKPPIVEVGTSPQVRYISVPAQNVKIIKNQPLEEASSSYGGSYVAEDIDDGGYIDGGLVENYGSGYDKGRHFEKEGGKNYEAAHHAVEGEKGDKGYKNEHSYEKGESVKHGAEENKGEVSEKEGEKKSHIDAGTKFSGEHKKAEGAKAENFVKKTGHRKGHKKSGFHRVHHKDEYKKDEEFFDEEHDSGEEKKEGHSHVEHAQAAGGNEKLGHHDSAYVEKQSGQKGEQEKGQSYNQEEGYKGENGQESHHAENAEFSKKGGHKEGEVHKHSDVGGGGIIFRD